MNIGTCLGLAKRTHFTELWKLLFFMKYAFFKSNSTTFLDIPSKLPAESNTFSNWMHQKVTFFKKKKKTF